MKEPIRSGPDARPVAHRPAHPGPGLPPSAREADLLRLQRLAGNQATTSLVGGALEGARGRREPSPPGVRRSVQRAPTEAPTAPPQAAVGVGFVREEGLNLRSGTDTQTSSLAKLRLGTRVHILEDESAHPTWLKVTTPTGTGFVSALQILLPPPALIQKDPGMGLVRVRPGQSFWGLVKQQYGIQGNEGTADQNINHFINAIRAVNDPDAFNVKTDVLDDIGNATVPGRDASDTLLKADYDLWIPSFGVAAAMDVGSGTVSGEITRLIQKVEQKIADFRAASAAAGKYIPAAVGRHAGQAAEGLIQGLIDFAIEAAQILAISTAAGALIGSLFGGVGAIPGAQIGFEIGLMILEYYGLAMMIESVLSMAGALLSQLGQFIAQVWDANGDPKKIDQAGQTLAEALGLLVSAVLLALTIYLTHKGSQALGRTRFAQRVGQTPLAKWMAARQKMTTTTTPAKGKSPEPTPALPKDKSPEPTPDLAKPKSLDEARAELLATLEARTKQIQAARGDLNVFRGKLRTLTASGNTPRPVAAVAAELDVLLTPFRRSQVVTGGGRSGTGTSTYIESLDGRFSIRITHNQVGPAPVGQPPFPRVHVYEGQVSGHGAHVCLNPGTTLADILAALRL